MEQASVTLGTMTTPPDAAPSAVLTYGEALRRLLSLADFERLSGGSSEPTKFDLSRMRDLAARMGEPQRSAPVLHVAGTKGKGSVAAMSASMLAAAGLRVGMFTSPHLHAFRERIRLNGDPIGEAHFAAALDAVWPHVEAMGLEGSDTRPTTFEVLTAMAFHVFATEGVDVQVLEVGLGGRLDCTNVADGDVAIITSLSMDHTAILGSTIEEIATEKAGIIKAGSMVVSAPQPASAQAVIDARAREVGATVHRLGEHITWRGGDHDVTGQSLTVRTAAGEWHGRVALLGKHQQENAAAALAAVQLLVPGIGRDAVDAGLAGVRWDGRFQVLARNPWVVVDGAHNGNSMERLREAVSDYLDPARVTVVFGCSADKELAVMAAELAPLADHVVSCGSRHPRSAAPAHVAEAFGREGVRTTVSRGVDDALEIALANTGAEGLVLVTGSLFVVAEALEYWWGIEPERYPELEPHASEQAG